METIPSSDRTGEVTRVIHSDEIHPVGLALHLRQQQPAGFDDDGLDEILTCLAFLLFPPVVETSVASGDSRTTF